MASACGGCKLCDCAKFHSNRFRATLCNVCFHGQSAHEHSGEAALASEQLFYLARIEGPFTWEQLRHWHESGFLRDLDKLLIASAPSGAPPGGAADGLAFRSAQRAYPDTNTAFLPPDVAAKWTEARHAAAVGLGAGAGALPVAVAGVMPPLDSALNLSARAESAAATKAGVLDSGDGDIAVAAPTTASELPAEAVDPLEAKVRAAERRQSVERGGCCTARWLCVVGKAELSRGLLQRSPAHDVSSVAALPPRSVMSSSRRRARPGSRLSSPVASGGTLWTPKMQSRGLSMLGS
jgi:hypothetical protein